ncbi:MAG: hypothetical protein ACTSU7_09295 [Candidatus Heimdallarchaeaceae archaeon]
MSMYKELIDVFKTDLVESYGYTEEEAIEITKSHGDDHVCAMISNLWDYWSCNFPVDHKDNEE